MVVVSGRAWHGAWAVSGWKGGEKGEKGMELNDLGTSHVELEGWMGQAFEILGEDCSHGSLYCSAVLVSRGIV